MKRVVLPLFTPPNDVTHSDGSYIYRLSTTAWSDQGKLNLQK